MARFYVYELIDPRSGAVFYVGKGSRNRLDHHEAEAGLAVEKRRIFHTADEGAAYQFEIEHIAGIGLQNLTNVLPGGGGAPIATAKAKMPFVWSVKAAERHAKTICRSVRALAEGKKFLIGALDITEAVRVGVRKVVRDIGREEAERLIAAAW